MAKTVHFVEACAAVTLCRRQVSTHIKTGEWNEIQAVRVLERTSETSKVTCKQCLHKLNAPVFVGQSRNRDQFQLRCSGGPWDGQDVVFPRQDSSHVNAGLSIPIRVGEFTGRYNLNDGTWVPKESAW